VLQCQCVCCEVRVAVSCTVVRRQCVAVSVCCSCSAGVLQSVADLVCCRGARSTDFKALQCCSVLQCVAASVCGRVGVLCGSVGVLQGQCGVMCCSFRVL